MGTTYSPCTLKPVYLASTLGRNHKNHQTRVCIQYHLESVILALQGSMVMVIKAVPNRSWGGGGGGAKSTAIKTNQSVPKAIKALHFRNTTNFHSDLTSCWRHELASCLQVNA